MQFLMGLNDPYKIVRSNILLMKPLPNVRQAYSMIIQEETQQQIGPSITENFSVAAAVQSRSVTQKGAKEKFCEHCNRSGHNIDECRKLKYHCKFCDNSGHTEDRCRLKKANQNARSIQSSNNRTGGRSAYAVETTIGGDNSTESSGFPVNFTNEQLQKLAQALTMINQNKNSGNGDIFANAAGIISPFNAFSNSVVKPWILDSGATDHITSDPSLLTQIQLPSVPLVNLPTGATANITHTGTMSFNSQLVLKNVLTDSPLSSPPPLLPNLAIDPATLPKINSDPSSTNLDDTFHNNIDSSIHSPSPNPSAPIEAQPLIDQPNISPPDPPRRSTRDKHPPAWHDSYILSTQTNDPTGKRVSQTGTRKEEPIRAIQGKGKMVRKRMACEMMELIQNVREIIFPCNPSLASLLEYRLRSLAEPMPNYPVDRMRKEALPPRDYSNQGQASSGLTLNLENVTSYSSLPDSTAAVAPVPPVVNQYSSWGSTPSLLCQGINQQLHHQVQLLHDQQQQQGSPSSTSVTPPLLALNQGHPQQHEQEKSSSAETEQVATTGIVTTPTSVAAAAGTSAQREKGRVAAAEEGRRRLASSNLTPPMRGGRLRR
ncbi:hypothetical protein GH714_019447 [Hevea brasiliensis]|uniref:CCHC-type domain-containing protein n=1 Tax=Hevea brasiliensis TaxID=3981 RepID=A0A6A6LYN1_HEVBR|nr:hypothetical protein GH714_019447 [Hevea brasiliensis]